MRRKRAEVIEPKRETITLHESVPDLAFELALYKMRYTTESTRNILNEFLREVGA